MKFDQFKHGHKTRFVVKQSDRRDRRQFLFLKRTEFADDHVVSQRNTTHDATNIKIRFPTESELMSEQ